MIDAIDQIVGVLRQHEGWLSDGYGYYLPHGPRPDEEWTEDEALRHIAERLYRAAIGGAETRIAELEAIGDELANDLEAELGARYGVERGVHPAMASRYDLDMAPVAKWRELVGGEPS